MSPLPPLADIRASHAPAVVILGNDALLAARPATPVQLAHACLAAGFEAVVPGSWGDELVADATLTALSTRANRPAIHCACPHVARRVLAAGSDLAPHLVSLVAPPIAAARYLRLHSPDELRVTYVGRCPAAADDAIDARLTPEELLAQLVDRGIDVSTQPEVFESVIPPDRRRHLSLPGGIPSAEILWARTRCSVATMKGAEFAAQLADLLLAATDTLIDPAPMVGCACTGALRGESVEPRAAVIALEPPRSAMPVVEETDGLNLELVLPSAARTATDLVADVSTPPARDEQRVLDGPLEALGDSPPPPPPTPNRRPRLTPPGMAVIPASVSAPSGPSLPPRRRSPVGTPRVVPGSVPFASDSEGRVLPRAYVARRRSPRGGIPAVTETGTASAAPQFGSAATLPVHLEAAPSPAAAPIAAPAVAIPTRDDDLARLRRDTERPVVRSVEPASSRAASTSIDDAVAPQAPAPPATPNVRQPRSGSAVAALTQWSVRIGASSARLRRNPRAVIAVALTAAGLLLGVAIGYSAARRGNDQSRSTAGQPARSINSPDDATLPRPSGARESVSAGGLAPAPGATRRPANRVAVRPAPGGTRRSSARVVVPEPIVSRTVEGVAPAPVPDTALDRAQRDSVSRADALNAERDAIRREIDLRRARVDSIERARVRLDSLRRAEQAATRPPRR